MEQHLLLARRTAAATRNIRCRRRLPVTAATQPGPAVVAEAEQAGAARMQSHLIRPATPPQRLPPFSAWKMRWGGRPRPAALE